MAAVTISMRGVQLVATAHGHKLVDLVHSADMNRIIGGVREVTISTDVTAKKCKGRQIQLERRDADSESPRTNSKSVPFSRSIRFCG